jgi:hypothetical protein
MREVLAAAALAAAALAAATAPALPPPRTRTLHTKIVRSSPPALKM